LRGRELSPKEVERRRQTALELGLVRSLRPGYQGPWWTAQEVARRTRRTPNAVRIERGRRHPQPLRRLATASPRGQPPAIIPEQGRGAGWGVVQSLAAVGSSTSGLSSVGSGIALSRKEHLMRARSKYVWAAAALAALAGVGLAPSAGESACCYFSA